MRVQKPQVTHQVEQWGLNIVYHNAVDEVYAEARHLLGPLIDALDEGEVVHSRDSGLVDYSQSGGD